MHFKRKKSKRSIRCSLCTPYRWMGNSKERRPIRDKKQFIKEKEYAKYGE